MPTIEELSRDAAASRGEEHAGLVADIAAVPVENAAEADDLVAAPAEGHPVTDAAADGTDPTFADLGLSETVLKAVRDLRYRTPTPVQAAAIPEVLAGRDLLAAAQTGTGKTAAFLLPALNNLDHVVRRGRDRKFARGRGPLMLIVTPTRELAQQIDEVCTKIAARTGHIAVTVVGGLSYNPQKSALKRGCDVLVATPGRLVDLINQDACHLDEVRVLVLDEADRMLDMGFLPDVRRIVALTPEDRQTLLFSATLDEQAVGAVTDLVRDPARVEIAPATATADTVDQYLLPVSLEAKNALLIDVLKREGAHRAIVFTRTKHRADACCRRLNRAGIKAQPIHGNRSQAQRERALADFRKGRVDVLVATDVLARGIDITDVRYVVNFDVPEEPTDYIHRIGRTGRAGEVGWALTFVTGQDIEEFYDIEALMGKAVELYDAAGLELGAEPPAVDPGRVPSARPGKKKTKRGKSTSKKKRGGEGRSSAAPRPARPKRSGRVRVHGDQAAEGTDRDGSAVPIAGMPGDAAPRDHGDGERRDARRAREDVSTQMGTAGGAAAGRAQRSGSRRGTQAGRNGATAHEDGRRRGAGKRGAAEAGRTRGAGNGSRSQGRAGGSRGAAQAHDWRNADLADDRRSRGGRGGRAGGRDNRATYGNGARGVAGKRGGSSRRPGDRGGRA